MTKEEIRLAESGTRKKHWKRWGPYLSERAWGTVREDYSLHGNAWEYLPHDHARSRAYRWNEDGLAGISDRRQMICFALAVWNERDPRAGDRGERKATSFFGAAPNLCQFAFAQGSGACKSSHRDFLQPFGRQFSSDTMPASPNLVNRGIAEFVMKE
jgi:hypothetical protein